MRRPRTLFVVSVSVFTACLGLSSAGVAAQEASYRPAVRADTVLEAPSGLRLRILVDAAALGEMALEVAELTFPGGARTGPEHRHGSTELLYVLSGTLDHVVEGRTHRLRPGMMGIVRAGDEVAHTVASDEPVRVLAIWVPGGELDRIRPAFRPVGPPAEAPLREDAPFRPELDRLRERWSRAYEEGDSVTLAGLYTADVVRMPYDAEEQVGRDAVMAGYASSFRSRGFLPDIELVPDEVRLVGEVVVERGDYQEILHPRNGGRALVEEGKYVSMARRDPVGEWRYSLSIFNRDGPARPVGGDASPGGA
jgi:uncharacterized cupin superfamily protein/ketosteroid isomerase-like protein